MKQLKRFTALLLIAVLLLGISAGATTVSKIYTDAGKITHVAAVDIASYLGIIEGYKNGSFKPKTTVTRAEFAKMIAVLMNAGVDVSASYVTGNQYADMADHWAKGYVGYCTANGYIAGKNATTFKPEDSITYAEAAKILLCALGYDARLFSLVGADWKNKTLAQALRTDVSLFDELKVKKNNYDENATREDACQMIFNAMRSTMLDCKATISTLDDVYVVDNQQIAKVRNTEFDYRDRPENDTMQLCEKLFPGLRESSSGFDSFGRPASVWFNKGTELGVYSTAIPISSSEGAIYGTTVNAAVGYKPINGINIHLNGKDISILRSSMKKDWVDEEVVKKAVSEAGYPEVEKMSLDQLRSFVSARMSSSFSNTIGQKDPAAAVLCQIWGNYNSTNLRGTSSRYITGRGYHTELYYDEATGVLSMTCMPYLPAQIIRSVPAVYDEEGEEVTPGYYVAKFLPADMATYIKGEDYSPVAPVTISEGNEIQPAAGTFVFTASQEVNGLEDMKPNDIVVVRMGCDDSLGGHIVDSVLACDKRSGKVTRISYGSSGGSTVSSFRINGTATNLYDPVSINLTGIAMGVSASFYVGTPGTQDLVFHMDTSDVDYRKNIFYVHSAAEIKDEFGKLDHYGAILLSTDGTTSEVVTDRDYAGKIDSLVTVEAATGDRVSLKSVGSNGSGLVEIRRGISDIKVTPFVLGKAGKPTTINGDENTLFVIGARDENNEMVYSTYTGVSKVPDTSAEYYAYFMEGSRVKLLFALEATSASVVEDYGVFFKNPAKDATVTVVEGTYKELNAIVKDEVKRVQIESALYDKLGNGYTLFAGYSTNKQGWINRITKVNGVTAFTTMEPLSNGVLTLQGKAFSYHPNILCYSYSVSRNALSVASADNLSGELSDQFQSVYTLNETAPGQPLAALCLVEP